MVKFRLAILLGKTVETRQIHLSAVLCIISCFPVYACGICAPVICHNAFDRWIPRQLSKAKLPLSRMWIYTFEALTWYNSSIVSLAPITSSRYAGLVMSLMLLERTYKDLQAYEKERHKEMSYIDHVRGADPLDKLLSALSWKDRWLLIEQPIRYLMAQLLYRWHFRHLR